jgi:hemerythrin-like domain-containing protein
MTTTAALPGFVSPGIGFEQPFEMLEACHERVQRSLALLDRLVEHVHGQGLDADARSAARDVLRYFDLAAPLHHEDEERHVLPRLAASADAESRALAALLQQEHRRQETLWQVLREPLAAWAAEPAEGAAPPPERFPAPDALSEFQALYARHIAREESVAYPQARADFPAAALAAMSEDMTARRRPARP